MGAKITVGTTWTESFLHEVNRLNNEIGSDHHIAIDEFYGSFPCDPMGTARSASRLPKNEKILFADYIRKCHDAKISFAYTNNSICTGGSKHLDDSIPIFTKHCEHLCNSGVDSIILSMPVFMEIVRKEFPQLKLIASTICNIDSIIMAGYYRDMGVARIVLPVDANRNYHLLESLVNEFCDIDFEVLMTDVCMYECPYRQHHFALQSHDSLEYIGELANRAIQNYPFDRCWGHLRKQWPAEILKSRWIRPEDIRTYENIGINHFKISGRTMPEVLILKSISAFLSRTYDGSLWDILAIIPGDSNAEGVCDWKVPNILLNGFVDYFIDNGQFCKERCGVSCCYCDQYAERIRKELHG